jgi:signal transduction histidine kinase
VSGGQLLSYLTWAVFVLLFVLVTATALRRPLWANLNLVLLFAMPTAIILISIAAQFGLVRPGPIPNAINTALVLAIAYLMLRLANDFTTLPSWVVWGGAIGLGLLVIGSFVFAPPRPFWLTLAQLGYFVGIESYAAGVFLLAARRAIGVTKRRMYAVAWGSLLLGLTIGANALRPLGSWLQQLSELSALAAGISYFIGFAPPLRLRRSWQEPELRAFLATTSRLAQRLAEPVELQQLERAAAATLGAEEAWIGRWSESRQQIDFSHEGREQFLSADSGTATGRAFVQQEPQFALYQPGSTIRSRLVNSALPHFSPRAVLAAPITSGERRYGVLTIFTQHAPVVVAEDLELVELLANQIATMFETHELAEALSRNQALSEVARLKEDFLSVAAHDLKTPLTTILAQAQRLERRMRNDPQAAAYLQSVELIAQEAQRLRHIVNELLDAERAERGELLNERQPLDLTQLVRNLANHQTSPRHSLTVNAEEGLVGSFDKQRLQQLVAHLLDNAVVYSPQGGTITVTLQRQGSHALLSVSDQGIGILPKDLPRLFERFFRGSNIDDRHYVGMGLSLFICRAIAEQHGGRIEATSIPGQGSTFRVLLPLESEKPHYVAA